MSTTPPTTGRGLSRRIVESIAGAIMLGAGILLQVLGARSDQAPASLGTPLLIIGGVLVAIGGVALSWIASSILTERQTFEARESARSEIDDKLDNLSRALGQAAGQISQAVEQADVGQIPSATGFALVSQATRTIYGQVNEIAVIRGQRFDAAQLLDTAARLDDLARQLSGPATKDDDLSKTRRELQDIQNQLASATPVRQYGSVTVSCPYCGVVNVATLGTLPGSTSRHDCTGCKESFNVHRAATGDGFARKRGAYVGLSPGAQARRLLPRWSFPCPHCDRPLSSIADGGARAIVCPGCITPLVVDPDSRSVELAIGFETLQAENFERSGTRPKFYCPRCRGVIKSTVITDAGFACICTRDNLVLTVSSEDFEAYVTGLGDRRTTVGEGTPV